MTFQAQAASQFKFDRDCRNLNAGPTIGRTIFSTMTVTTLNSNSQQGLPAAETRDYPAGPVTAGCADPESDPLAQVASLSGTMTGTVTGSSDLDVLMIRVIALDPCSPSDAGAYSNTR